MKGQDMSHHPHSRQKRCKFAMYFKTKVFQIKSILIDGLCKMQTPFFTVLGLFNLIQFSNARCNSTDNDKQGICYTASECRERGGNAKGTCAAGFGVCCLCKGTFFKLVYLVLLQLKSYHRKSSNSYNCIKMF